MSDTLSAEDLAVPAEFQALIDYPSEDMPIMGESDVPAPYPHTETDAREAQDDLDELGGPGDAPRTSREAIKLGRLWIATAVFFGVGYCLKVMRSLFGVMPLWPDAATAWEEADYKHRQTDPDAIPWGVFVFWLNGRYGHIALSIGGGWCITTDYKSPGRLCIARISALGAWCGGTLVGWTEDVNGVHVWKPKAPAKHYGAEDRLKLVQGALDRAKARNAKPERIAWLRAWRDQLRERIAKKKENDR